uniref:Uncharacterized protein n=1 Tax=Trichuris muris TaxID=70415 RepID=A0A5S6QNS2_TRIMR
MGLQEVNPLKERGTLLTRNLSTGSFVDSIVYMKCTRRSLALFNFFLVTLVMVALLFALCLDYWVYTVEPRMVNLTDEFGELKELLFHFHLGYWRICRQAIVDPEGNLTAAEQRYLENDKSVQFTCLHKLSTPEEDDLTSFSIAGGAIGSRMLLMLFLHFTALLLTSVGFIFAVNGYLHSNKKCITAAVVHVMAGILLSICIMQFICIVDDEMNTRLKPTSEGEPSKYKSYYGSCFLLTAMSFVLLQLCALNELNIFLELFSSSEEKVKIVPGLSRLLQKSTARLKPLFFIPDESELASQLHLNPDGPSWKN